MADKLVMEFISRFGVTYWIKSDLGRQFTSELFGEMCKLLEIEHRTSTAFHPQVSPAWRLASQKSGIT